MNPLDAKRINPELIIIPEPNIESIANYIQENNCNKIIILTGGSERLNSILAGISTSAGIPDFRSKG